MSKRLDKGRWNHWSVKVIAFYLLISLLAPLISNDLPLLRIKDGEWSFPFLQAQQDYNFSNDKVKGDFELYALFRYSSGKSDPLNMSFRGPFDEQVSYDSKGDIVEIPMTNRHWLGTNLLGSDLLADIIYGTRITLFISFFATVVAGLVALLLGFMAGWIDQGLIKVSVVKTVLMFAMFICWTHILFNIRGAEEKLIGWGVSIAVFGMLFRLLSINKFSLLLNWKVLFPADGIFTRVFEFFSAMPRIILVLAFVHFFSTSITSMIFLLALSAWVDLARLVRSELQTIKSKPYIDAALMSGVDGVRLLFVQVLPNIWPSVLVYLLFIFAANISIEAGLSFLGYGLPATVKTLGGLIAEGKSNFKAWWMIVFPGLWLTILIYAMFSLSDRLRLTHVIKK
jgi:peptide/nickel transport system permease protein